MKNWSSSLVTTFFLLLFLLSPMLKANSKTETLEKNLAVDPSSPVSLEFVDVDGDLSFSSWEKNLVKIHVTKETKMRDLKKAEKLLHETKVEITQRKNEIKIRIHYPKMKGIFFWLRDYSRIKVSTEITLPPRSNLNCSLVDGSIYGEKITGEIFMKTVDGSIHLKELRDSIKIKTTDGRITLKDIRGEVEAETTDGDIDISGLISKLFLSTVDGDIDVKVLPHSLMEDDWNVATVDGDVKFSLWPEFSAELYLQTSGGDVNSKLPLIFTDFSSGKKISGKINQGGHLLRIKTTDGDITLRKLSSDLILSTKGKDNYFLFD